jgi:membrane protease YdiL (CAAX protease family)
MALVGGIAAVFFAANVAVELLRRAGVTGFHTVDSTGSVLLATLSFHGTAIIAGILFLKFHGISWHEISGLDTKCFTKQIQMIIIALAIAVPVMAALKISSMFILEKVGWPVEDQRAVELLLAAKSTGMKIYLGIFAVVIAPMAEEFVFRGLMFSGFKKAGWPRCGWVIVSLLFAAIHNSMPVFLPLFVFALMQTWLYETTEGLLAPIMAHSLFNAGNLTLLFIAEKYHLLK